jgi:hypothetical protein
MDLGIIDEATGNKLKWGAVVPKEALDMMFPEPEKGPGFYRRPFTPTAMKDFQLRIKEFVKAADVVRPGIFNDRPTHQSLLKKYRAWQTSIGYHGALSNAEQNQVDREWDAWIASKEPKSGWNPTTREVRALRAKGPITRGATARFRDTPIGPREALSPLASSVKTNLPKRREPEAQPQPEDKPTRINIRNKKTGKRMFSDDGGRTWQNVK